MVCTYVTFMISATTEDLKTLYPAFYILYLNKRLDMTEHSSSNHELPLAAHDSLEMQRVTGGDAQSEQDTPSSPINETTDTQHQLNSQDVREKWGSQIQFILACVSSIFAIRSFSIFPYYCYRNGGLRVFLVPYFVILIFVFMPLIFLMSYIGRKIRQGPVGVFKKLCPFFKGIGIAIVMTAFIDATYYIVTIAWALFYLFASLQNELPWNKCNQTWNSPNCLSNEDYNNHSVYYGYHDVSSQAEYFKNRVLDVRNGIDDLGGVRGELVGVLALAWILICLCLFKGVASMGKVVYLTTIVPYILVFVLLIRGLTLPGASIGIKFLTVPKWAPISSLEIWLDAAYHILYTTGLHSGAMIVLCSYNNYRTTSLILNTAVVTTLISVFDILSSLFVFSAIGYIASLRNVVINEVATAGFDLTFATLPAVFDGIGASQFWSIVYFSILICVGIGHQFTIVEVVVTTFKDGFPFLRKFYFNRKEVLVAYICVLSFLLGLPYVTRGGRDLLELTDWSITIAIITNTILIITAFTWFNGLYLLKRIYRMQGDRYHCVMVFLLILLLFWFGYSSKIVQFLQYMQYDRFLEFSSYYYKTSWNEGVGWFLVFICLVWIPLGAIHTLITSKGSIAERLRASFTVQL